MNVLVTGGAGFIGSALCRLLIAQGGIRVVAYDKLTYAANLGSLNSITTHPDFRLVRGDICNQAAVLDVLRAESIDTVVHLAAETHVDRSIDDPAAFLRTNVLGTACLLEAALGFWRKLSPARRDRFRFHHVSTDEVFGDLGPADPAFSERTPYAPSSPYSASKASSDHLVRAWAHTYGLAVTLSHCSNNYGAFHHPEKLIPLAILAAIEHRPIPVYGTGSNVRDWLHVDDHARALVRILDRGCPGQSYNIGGSSERANLDVVRTICALMDRKRPMGGKASHHDLIALVADRPGHDRRYAMDTSKIQRDLGWQAIETFDTGLERTVDWYLDNRWWWEPLRATAGQRLGLERA